MPRTVRDPNLPAPRLIGLALLALTGIGAAVLGLWLLHNRSEPLTLSITSWPGNEYFYLADQKGLARRVGLDLQIKQYSSLSDQRQAFENGDDVVMATTVPEAIAVCQETPANCPLLILAFDESRGADRLIGRAELGGPAQLAGRRVGLERAVLSEYLLLRGLATTRLRLENLQLQFDGPVGLVERLRRGDLDAIVTYAPYDTTLRRDARFRVLFSSAAIPGEVVDVLAVDPAFARRAPTKLKALVRTWWLARDYARQHRSEALAVMAGRQRISARQFIETEAGVRYPGPGEQRQLLAPSGPLARSLTRLADLMVQSGRIRRDAPLPRLSTDYLEPP
ncbi:MAG: ABC transporter substrate-binding protein [Synechococcaceae cyanobacterium]|nr:ABC transporter substrate-binding protein [Synechococcaceae cyanobacterium]